MPSLWQQNRVVRLASHLAWLTTFLALFPLACLEKSAVGPAVSDEGLLILDSAWVIDAFSFDSATCMELNSRGYGNADSIPAATLALVKVVSTACYRVHVKVEDSASKTVRSFDRQFQIFGRQNGDKGRGVEGYVAWDGRDDQGHLVPKARYLWRMDFDFGNGNLRKVRADIRLD